MSEDKKIKDVSEIAKSQSEAQMDKEIKEAELKLRQLEIKAKTAELQDLEERLAEREMKRENKRQRSMTNGKTLQSLAVNDAAAQKRCNHKKGGNGAHGIVNGQGDDSQFAVMKHQFCNGDIWVRCLRCGKTWKPPIREAFKSDAEFDFAVRQYEDAVAFQTRNVMSGSIQYRFSDGGDDFRTKMKDVTLR